MQNLDSNFKDFIHVSIGDLKPGHVFSWGTRDIWFAIKPDNTVVYHGTGSRPYPYKLDEFIDSRQSRTIMDGIVVTAESDHYVNFNNKLEDLLER